MLVFKLVVALLVALFTVEASYKIGVGIYDMTGPAAEINFMGYAGKEVVT